MNLMTAIDAERVELDVSHVRTSMGQYFEWINYYKRETIIPEDGGA